MSSEPMDQATEAATADVAALSGHDSVWRRLCGRPLMDMSVLLLIAVVFSGLHAPGHVLNDADIWWHLANARYLTTTHHFMHADPYSFTVNGQPWVNPEWLSEVPYWFGYVAFGLIGISIATFFGAATNVLLVYWRSYLKGGNAGVALWTTMLAFLLMLVNINARTILFAYIALSVELAILEALDRGNSRLLWFLPPLFCVWINLHGSWIIGLFLLVVYFVSGLFRFKKGMFDQQAMSRPVCNRFLIAIAASLALLFVNPYGWRLVWNPFDMAFNQNLNIANVQEWQPLNLAWFGAKAAVAAIGLMVVANAFNNRKWKLYEFIFVFFAWYAAFDHARFTFLAAVLTTPMLAEDLTRSFFPIQKQKTIHILNVLMAVGTITIIVLYFPTNAKMKSAMAEHWPLQTIASIQPSWRTLNQEHLGGLMDFEGKPSFIDTRWDIFEHHGEMKDFIDILRLQDALALLDKYRIDHVLIRQDEPLAYLLEHVRGWETVRQEGVGHDEYTLLKRVP